jgi:cobyrinic acid a,c-diamide synthase
MSVIIAGERSGVGKTTITLAILASMIRQGERVQSFKVGPDYIDPMFHAAVTGQPCRNLDPVLTSESYVQRCFQAQGFQSDYCLLEGVMGLFDGAVGDRDWASTAHIAKLLELPIVLVVDCGKLSRSVAAIVHGYRSFDPELKIAGVILNHVSSDRHRNLLKQALKPLNIKIFGILGRHEPIQLPDRYLGLVPTDEIQGFDAITEKLADLGDRCLDWTALKPLIRTEADLVSPPPMLSSVPKSDGIRIAIARDAAFNFYYEDNLDSLRDQGAKLVPWSPLREDFPNDIHGLLLGGGFPEQFAQILSQNQKARHTLKQVIADGLPTYAECGGLMYLCDQLMTFDGQAFPMVGAIPNQVQMKSKLSLGYRVAQCHHTNGLLHWEGEIQGHEFHHSQLLQPNKAPLLQLKSLSQPDLAPVSEGFSRFNIHASYLHLHWGDRPDIPQQFLAACQVYRSALS